MGEAEEGFDVFEAGMMRAGRKDITRLGLRIFTFSLSREREGSGIHMQRPSALRSGWWLAV